MSHNIIIANWKMQLDVTTAVKQAKLLKKLILEKRIKKETKIVVDEMAKLDKGEVEFLFDTIKGAMIPGKYLPIAMKVVQKLKNQYQLLDRKAGDLIVGKIETDEELLNKEIGKAQKEVARTKHIDGELYIEED